MFFYLVCSSTEQDRIVLNGNECVFLVAWQIVDSRLMIYWYLTFKSFHSKRFQCARQTKSHKFEKKKYLKIKSKFIYFLRIWCVSVYIFCFFFKFISFSGCDTLRSQQKLINFFFVLNYFKRFISFNVVNFIFCLQSVAFVFMVMECSPEWFTALDLVTIRLRQNICGVFLLSSDISIT